MNYTFDDQNNIFIRNEPEILQNGNTTTEVIFLFSKNAIPTYVDNKYINLAFPKTKRLDSNNPIEVVQYFYNSEEFKAFFNSFKKAFYKIIEQYGGFPSDFLKTKYIMVTFGRYQTGITYNAKDFDIRIMWDIDNFIQSEKTMYEFITHELYHFVSMVYHNEHIHYEKLQLFNLKLRKPMLKHKADIEAYINIMSKELKINLDQNRVDIEEFFNVKKENPNPYFNTILDMALIIVAIQMGDLLLINRAINFEPEKFNKISKPSITQLFEIAQYIKSAQLPEGKRKFYLSVIHLLQFMRAFTAMPYNLLPLTTYFGENAERRFHFVFKTNIVEIAKTEIALFELMILRLCEPAASTRFMEFWDQLKETVTYMNILDPVHEKYQTKIHNPAAIKASIECYKTLNRQFMDLFNEIKPV